MTGRAVPFGMLLTRTSPIIRTRTVGAHSRRLGRGRVPVFTSRLNEREVFRTVFSFQQTLDSLDPREVSNLDKAQVNAEKFAVEVIERLRASRTATSELETAR